MSKGGHPRIAFSEAGPSQPSSTTTSPALDVSPVIPSASSPRLAPTGSRLAKYLLPGRSRSSSTASVETATGIAEEDEQSGRSTPEQRRRTGRAAASLLADDSRYKKFCTQVDRALQSFESVNEWADFISFLSRLLKTLQVPHPPFHEIPRKLVVAKRLAQCLNPALPSGVHQRALEVYAHIFSTIGVDGLRRDLQVWSSGLFPFFQFATTSARPHLLNIYETYYLPLGSDLRSAAKAFLLALLPGLEEETGDFFERVLNLLSNLSEDISPDFFLHNIFLILISSSSSRLAALNYLARRLPKPPENLQSGLVLRGIAAALEDENVLVRRNGLDLLFRIVRMDGELYRSAEVKDKDLLLRATAGVVLQRDISLSRRVYIWLLGSGDTSEQQIDYFKQNGHDQLAALLQLDMAAGDLRSYRIFLALMDKWEVGALLGEQLALSAIRAAMSTSEDPAQEISITIRAVYEAIDPGVTWKQLFRLLGGQQKEDIDFVLSLMSTVKQHEDEVKKVYVPATLDYCLVVAVAPSPIRSSFLRLAEALLPLIPVTEWILASSSADLPECGAVFDLPIDEAVRVARACLIPRIAVKVQEIGRIVKEQDEILVTHRMLSTLLESEAIPFQSSEWLNSLLTHLVHSSFEVVESTASIVLQAVRYPLLRAVPMDNIVEQTMTSLLRFLRLDHSAHHARAVELIFELKLRAGVYVLENSICEGLQGLNRLNAMEEFGTLWRLTENSMLPGEIFFTPMLMMLDALGSRDPVLQRVADTWLRTNMGSNFRFLDPLLCRLLHPSQDLAISTHLMDTLAAFVQYGGESLGKACQNCETDQSPYTQVSSSKQPYMDLIVDVLSQHLHYTFAGPTRSSLLLRLHSSTLEVMKRLLAYGVGPKILDRLQLCLLDKAEEAVRVAELNLQSKLLSLMNATLPNVPKRHRKSTSISEKPTDRDGRIISLIQTGIVDTRCHPVLRYWIDFILESAGHFQHRRDLLESLSTSLTAQTRLAGKMPGSGHDLELDMFLEGLERVIMLLLPKAQDGKGEDGKEGSSILGYMSGVFTVEGPVHVPVDVQWLDDAVHALLSVWTTSTGTPLRSAQRVLSKTFKTAATAAFGSLVRIWALQSAEISDMAIFDAVDHLTTSAQKVVEMIGEGVVGKKGESVDPIHLGFLEAYLRRLEAPIAVQIWSTTFTLARDLSATATTPIARAQLYPLLRCLTALARTVATTSALEDKRMRRDLLETWSKLLDHVVVNLPRLGEVDFWQRGGKTSNEEVNAFFASEVIPSLRNLLVDNDRVAVACSSIATGSLIPAFRQHKVNPSILNIVSEMSHLSGVRSWRPLVGDAFNDARFFRINLMNTDKERFLDLLGRIQAGPSANIFVNREQEMISRSLNLRRLSFVLLSAENNHYLTQLPSIQEKLVDILRNDVVSPQVHSEVYLCLRVLLCRISAQHITNFWPVILSELVKVFEGAMDEPPPDGSEELLLVLAACKFLELLLLMQSEDFQIHQWMFVTDTTDAAFPLEGYEPESILDRLNEILSEHAHIAHTAKDLLDWEEQVGPRRPRLTGLKSLDSLYQLQPFFARASIDTFEGVYSGQGVDWEKVEEGLLEEIFEK